MSNLKLIESLCLLSEEQSRLIRALATRLAQLGDTDPALADQLAAADALYCRIIGDEETPDFLADALCRQIIGGEEPPDIAAEPAAKQEGVTADE